MNNRKCGQGRKRQNLDRKGWVVGIQMAGMVVFAFLLFVLCSGLAFAQTLEQEGFLFRADDGSETGATWLATQDTNITRQAGVNTRLRVLLNATGDPASTRYQLEYKKSTDASWQKADVAPSSPTVELKQTLGAGTWTAPPGVTSVTVETWGGGGSGGGMTANGKAGGGGGPVPHALLIRSVSQFPGG